MIIYPSGPVQIDGGDAPTGGTPQPYLKTAATPNVGTAPDTTEDRRGSLGREGMRALETFVREGGVLIAEGAPAALFPDYRLVSGITVEQPTNLWAPGSILKAMLGDATSPILYGFDQKALGVMYRDGPVLSMSAGGGGRGGGGRGFTPPAQPNLQPMATPSKLTTLAGPPASAAAAPEGRGGRGAGAGGGGGGGGGRGGADTSPVPRPRVLLSFPNDPNDLLLSGGLVGPENLTGRAALVDVPLGKGHAVLFGIRPFWRFETQGSFFLVFNAMLNWNHLSAGASPTS